MFKTRLLSGIVLIILMLFVIIKGGDITLFSLLPVSLVGMYELYRVFKLEKSPLAIIGYLITIIFYFNLKWIIFEEPFLIVMFFLISLMFVYVFLYPKYEVNNIIVVFFGFFYVAMMLSFIYQIRMLDKGLYLTFLIFICSWGCDTCAYCIGKLFGKHKMAPILSPKKSIEGAIGGVIGTALLTLLYLTIFKSQIGISNIETIILMVISVVAAFISMVGDLTASAIKRNYDIKDYGKLIPGHGGVMDRFDSVMITAPIIYYLAIYFL